VNVYVITYDLKSPGRDYSPLYEAIKDNYAWWHYLESTWLVATNETAMQIYNRLVVTITTSDRLLIVRISPDYHGWLPADAWNWMDTQMLKQECQT